MPRAKSHTVITRQWEILNLLPNRMPGITARSIADELERKGFDISKRTVERDLDELSSLFGIACNDKGRPFGWYWMNGAGVNLPALTLAEALSLRIVEQQLRPLLPMPMLKSLEGRFLEAKNKLDAMAGDNTNASWPGKIRNKSVNLQLRAPMVSEAVLEAVQSALLEDRQLEVEYRRPDDDKAYTTVLNPLCLVQGGPTTYLAATAWKYDDVLYYAIHRMQSAKKLESKTIRPEDFDIDSSIPGDEIMFGSQGSISLEARVSEWLSKILMETPISKDQVIRTDGDVSYLSATVEDSWQLRWWILSQGEGIKVLQPKSLKNEIIKGVKSTLRLYADE